MEITDYSFRHRTIEVERIEDGNYELIEISAVDFFKHLSVNTDEYLFDQRKNRLVKYDEEGCCFVMECTGIPGELGRDIVEELLEMFLESDDCGDEWFVSGPVEQESIEDVARAEWAATRGV
jgi:hypothetical protein